ncbi:CapA family protein [Anaerobacillus sp. MEB173]|uniref:CapA family protein n=1 Tax=Anaerobacillus sp. MEB173 TaxID=3383345 RepID=UPI003F8E73A8
MNKKWYLTVIAIVLISIITACTNHSEEETEYDVEAPANGTEEEKTAEQDHRKEQDTVPVTESEQEPALPITFSFAGDTMAAGKVAPYIEEYGYQYSWEQAKPYLEESDIAMVNLETAVSEKGVASNKSYAFQSHPNLIKGMKWAGVDLVTVANNHSLDYGIEAFTDTLHHLTEEGIVYVGGGMNEAEAYRAKQVTVRGKTISFLGFSSVLPAVSWYAGENQPGLASGYQVERVYDVASQAVHASDITIVYMHWGEELADYPRTSDREMAHTLIDLGVDLVIGAHPHVLQGLEYYNGKLIAYSLGNFIFTTSSVETARQSAVLQVAIDEEGAQSAKVYPMTIDQGAVWQADEQETKVIMQRLSSLSEGGTWTEHGEFLPIVH